jgi:hypothetical protein
MPVRQMTDEEADRIFGGGLVIFGQVRPKILIKNGVKNIGLSESKDKLSKSLQPGLNAIGYTILPHSDDP